MMIAPNRVLKNSPACRGWARTPPALALVLSLAAVGCGGGGATFEPEEATALIQARFPEAELELRTARVDENGQGVAFARFNAQTVSFYFQPSDAGWVLDALDFEGSLYYIRDLEQIQATMESMLELADALASYKAANGDYPVGETSAGLQVLVPEFLASETSFNDAWQQVFDYESDGDDYTLRSLGADKASGSRDDIILHDGEFIGAGSSEGQG